MPPSGDGLADRSPHNGQDVNEGRKEDRRQCPWKGDHDVDTHRSKSSLRLSFRSRIALPTGGAMTVLRIVTNIATDSIPDVRKFYSDLFGLDAVMDHGWLVTLASRETTIPQLSIASEGGSGTPVPDLSIEVDDVDKLYVRANEMGCRVVYDLTDEPWGVRRFFIADPTGKLLNVLSHLR
jgi:predicted enzyme related to lactoylglutathione lyase